MTSALPTPGPGKAFNAVLWILQALLCAGFLIAGGMKLGGHTMQIQNFNLIGLGQWFRYVTGAIEVLCAILILIPRTAAPAAVLLFCVMVGAIIAHVTKLGVDAGLAAPPILAVMALIVAWGRRPQTGDLPPPD